jgi:hypothetical protein
MRVFTLWRTNCRYRQVLAYTMRIIGNGPSGVGGRETKLRSRLKAKGARHDATTIHITWSVRT